MANLVAGIVGQFYDIQFLDLVRGDDLLFVLDLN